MVFRVAGAVLVACVLGAWILSCSAPVRTMWVRRSVSVGVGLITFRWCGESLWHVLVVVVVTLGMRFKLRVGLVLFLSWLASHVLSLLIPRSLSVLKCFDLTCEFFNSGKEFVFRVRSLFCQF